MHAGDMMEREKREREREREREKMCEPLLVRLLRQAANARVPQRLKLTLKVCVHV